MFVLVESLAAALEGDFLLVHYSLGGCVCFGVRVCVWVAGGCVWVCLGGHTSRVMQISTPNNKNYCVYCTHTYTQACTYTRSIQLDFCCVRSSSTNSFVRCFYIILFCFRLAYFWFNCIICLSSLRVTYLRFSLWLCLAITLFPPPFATYFWLDFIFHFFAYVFSIFPQRAALIIHNQHIIA